MKRWLYVGLILIAILGLAWGISAEAIYRFSQQDETRPADAAIVLGAAAFGSQPSPVLRERINHAIRLYEQRLVDWIIFTGGKGASGESAEATVAADYARRHGIPDDLILVEDQSQDSAENLANAYALGQAHGLQSYLIVSTPFHMKRAIALAHDLGMDAYSSPTRTIQWISWVTQSRAFVQEVFSYWLYLIETRLNQPDPLTIFA